MISKHKCRRVLNLIRNERCTEASDNDDEASLQIRIPILEDKFNNQ